MSPQCSKADLGIVPRKIDIDRARDIVLVEHLAPVLAAVSGLENAAVRVRRKGVAQRRHQHHVRIVRVHPHHANVPRVVESNVLPALAGIQRFINTLALIYCTTNVADVARANVDNFRFRRRYGNGPDGSHMLLIEDRSPDHATVHGFPHAATGRSHVIDRWIARDADDG